MANKAFGYFNTSGSLPPGTAFGIQFKYVVVDSVDTPVTSTSSVTIDVVNADTTFSIWSKVVTAVRAAQSDSSMVVVPLGPSGLDYLVLGNTY
jgi:hypothetical protein